MRPDRPWNIFCMEWKRCVRIVRGYGLLLAVFGNDTVWAGMGNGSVSLEVGRRPSCERFWRLSL